MATVQIMRGCDVPMRVFQIVDPNNNNAPIEISTINDIKINVYKRNEQGAKTNVAIFRLSPEGNNGQIETVDDALGKVGFVVNRTMTKGMKPGKIYAEIEVNVYDDFFSPPSVKKIGKDNFEVCEIIENSNAEI